MLKKAFLFFLFPFAVCLFSSCVEVVEEFWLSEDGSGRYAVTVDFSALLRDSVFSKRLELEVDSLRLAGGPTVVDSAFLLFGKGGEKAAGLPASRRRAELLGDFEGRVFMDLEQKKLWKRIEFGFDSPRDFEAKMRAWRSATAILKPSSGPFGEPFFGALAPKIAIDGREATCFFDFSKTGNEAVAAAFTKTDDALLNAFLRSAEHRLVLHLPKKIKKKRGSGFVKIDATTVESRRKWIDLIDGEPLWLRVKMKK